MKHTNHKHLSLRTLPFYLIACMLATGAHAQDNAANHAALVFTGNAQSTFTVLTNNSVSDRLESSYEPGVEIMFRPKSRISFAAGFKEFRSDSLVFHDVSDKGLSFVRPDGTAIVLDPDTIAWSLDLTTKETTRVVTGLAYVNVLTQGPVRPFVGGGVGIGFAETEYRRGNPYVHPLFQEAGFVLDLSTNTTTSKVFFPVAKAGVHVFAGKHFFVGGAGGYQNGPFGEFRIGVSF